MAGKTEVIMTDRFKVVHVDPLNWQVFELREIKKPQDPRLKNREGQVDWVRLPAFFGSVDVAARYVLMHSADDAGSVDVKALIELMDKARSEIVAACKGACRRGR